MRGFDPSISQYKFPRSIHSDKFFTVRLLQISFGRKIENSKSPTRFEPSTNLFSVPPPYQLYHYHIIINNVNKN